MKLRHIKVIALQLTGIISFMYLYSSCSPSLIRTDVRPGQHAQSIENEISIPVNVNTLLYIPDDYLSSDKEWPLILFLHGAGERGSDLSKVEIHGPPKLIAKENKKFPFVIVSPQCPEDDWWPSKIQIETLNLLLDDIVSHYRIDKNRIYVTGLSMGGYGAWQLAATYPNRFAAIAPICGGGNPDDAEKIAHIPIWVFHGAKDDTVPVSLSEEMVAALEKAGSDVKFTVYPEAKHDSWTATYENPELYEWFLNQVLPENE